MSTFPFLETQIKAPRASLDKEIAAHSLLDLSSGKQDEEEELENSQGQVIPKKKLRRENLVINLRDMPTEISTLTMKTPSVEFAAEDVSRHLSGSTAGFIPPKATNEAVIVEPLPSNRPDDSDDEDINPKMPKMNTKNEKDSQAKVLMVNDHSENMVNGKYFCKTCKTSFTKLQQYTMHRNVHAIERPWKCKECNVSFRNEGQLQKHYRSETHAKHVTIQQQFGPVSAENPRPFQCHHCNIGFRVHGHLTKHFRSKGHIQKLESLSLLPPGSFGILERKDLSEMDASDCDTALNSLKNIVEESEQQRSKKNTAQENDSSYRLKCGLCHMKNFESIDKLQVSLLLFHFLSAHYKSISFFFKGSYANFTFYSSRNQTIRLSIL